MSYEDQAKTEKGGDWQPVPQEGEIIQIQGKNNAPPHGKYHHLVKDWFTSPHFLNPERGEDFRPKWKLANPNFTTMAQLYNPEVAHVLYYHPGDYGVENPPVTTDYNGMVRSMMNEATYDPENKRLKHLVQWAKQFGELPQLKEALQNPPNLENLQRGMQVDHTQDPHYQQWVEANPEPDRPGGACPNCGAQDIRENHYGDGYDLCNNCHHEWYVGNANREQADPEQAAAYQQWKDTEARERQEARQRQLAGTWEQSPAGQAVTALHNMIDYHMGAQPERIASTHADGWNCWCNNCGWDLGLPDDFRIAALIKEANGFNKVRNMLTKSNALTPKNAIALEAMRQQFADHPDMAEWLHREFRKGRVSMEAKPGVRSQATRALADALDHEQTIANRLRDYKTYMEYANNEDYSQADRDYYRRNAEAYKTQAEEYQKYADDAWAQVNEVDPEEVAKGLQFSVPEGARPDSWGNGKRPLSPDHLEIIKELMKKRGQRWKNATPEEKAEFEGADDDTRARWQQLNKEYREWEKQDRNERGEWPENKAFNKLEQNNIMKTQIPELYEQAEEEALGRLGLKLGNVIHSYPDGWTLRHINSPEAANIESEMLGHCIRTYGEKIASGDSVNLSLRDPKGYAHATFEIKPKKGLRFDWDQINPQFEKLEQAGMCPECGSMVDENGHCPKCGFDFGVDPVFAQYTPEQLRQFREQAEQERDTLPRRAINSPEYRQFRKDMIARGLARPQWAGGSIYQIQGKGGAASATLVDKYGKYFRQWNDALPHEERAVGSSYTGASNPVYHVNELDDYTNKVDRLGFQAPNRTIDWDSIVKSLHPGAISSVNQRAAQEPQNGEQYDPTLGQQAYEFAAGNDQLFDLYRAVNAWDKPKAEQNGQNPVGLCPRCEERYRQYPNRYEQGMVYCGYCGEEYPEDEAEWNGGGHRTPERRGPAYSEYQAAAVQHLGNLMAQHPELQTLGAHGADQVVNMACSNCGGKIQPCQTCGADQPGGADHGICENCNNVAYFPWMQNGQQGQVQAKTAATHPNHPVPTPHIGQHGQDCHCLWFDGIGGDHTASVKTADKFNDYLMGRDDLQTPEAQEFLGHLGQNYLTDQTDALMPWVVREWKKGRIEKPQNWGSLRYLVPNEDGGGQEYNLAPHNLQRWGEWFNSNHPSRRGVDIMQLKTPDMHNKIQEWENALKQEEREKAKGQVVKAWPDGWTIQRLTDPDILKYEGREMSNCVGGYSDQTADGTSMIYSLRDEDNVPHTTLEISPSERTCPQCQWTGGRYTPNARRVTPRSRYRRMVASSRSRDTQTVRLSPSTSNG
jgi:hypothetical protein